MNTFHCKIVSCDKVFFNGPCTSLKIPAADGEYVFMAKHEDCIASLVEGNLVVKDEQGKALVGICSTGIAIFSDNAVTVIADTIDRPEDIDAVRAREAKERAEEDLKEAQSLAEYKMSQAALARAMARLRGYDKYIGGDYNR